MHTVSVLIGETAQKMYLIMSAIRSVKIFLFSKNEGERKQAPLRQTLTLQVLQISLKCHMCCFLSITIMDVTIKNRSSFTFYVLDQFPAIKMISIIHLFKVSIQNFFIYFHVF